MLLSRLCRSSLFGAQLSVSSVTLGVNAACSHLSLNFARSMSYSIQRSKYEDDGDDDYEMGESKSEYKSGPRRFGNREGGFGEDRRRGDFNSGFRQRSYDSGLRANSRNSRDMGTGTFRKNFERRNLYENWSTFNNVDDATNLKSNIEYTQAKDMKFKDIPNLARPLQKSLEEIFKYENCSPVQSAVFESTMSGENGPVYGERDLLVQAKTGTGKTLAFLIPAINDMLSNPKETKNGCNIVIISPTRELALQITKEAEKLANYTDINVVPFVGGSSRGPQFSALNSGKCHIIVGTPGRILDIFQQDQAISEKMKNVKTLILDEADRMLEIGFKDDIVSISNQLPVDKTTLLFSATYPNNIAKLVKDTMRPDFKVLNTISPDELRTVDNVKQYSVVAPLDEQFAQIYSLLSRAFESGDKFKAIFFAPTLKAVEFIYNVMEQMDHTGKTNVTSKIQVLTSNLSQAQRSRASEAFKASSSSLLLTTDVSGRGVDYPDVDLVLQFGVPTNTDMYIHRIGRTARAGKSGESVILLNTPEKNFLKVMKDLPLKPINTLSELDAMKKFLSVKSKKAFDDKQSMEIFKNANMHHVSLAFNSWASSMIGYYTVGRNVIATNRNELTDAYREFAVQSKRLFPVFGVRRPPKLPPGISYEIQSILGEHFERY